MSWQSWAARIGGYALAPWTAGASIPIGESVAQGINAHDAAKTAVGQQTAATGAANAGLDRAGGVNQQLFDSQRRDFQSLANTPYQSLAQMSGISIPDITPLQIQGGVGGPMQAGTLGALTPAATEPQNGLRTPLMNRGRQTAAQQTASGYSNRQAGA